MQNVQPASKLHLVSATLLETVATVQQTIDALQPVLDHLCQQEPRHTSEQCQLIRTFVYKANEALCELERAGRFLQHKDLITGHKASFDGWEILAHAIYTMEMSCPKTRPIAPQLAQLVNNAMAAVVVAMIPLIDAVHAALREITELASGSPVADVRDWAESVILNLDTKRRLAWWSCRRPKVPSLGEPHDLAQILDM